MVGEVIQGFNDDRVFLCSVALVRVVINGACCADDSAELMKWRINK